MVRMRDVMQLAWNGEWGGEDPNITLDLPGLINLTVPTDWDPPVASVDDWNTNQAAGGNDLDRVKAEQITQDLNGRTG